LGTLAVNVSGCLAMGFLAAAWSGHELIRDETRIIILVGVIGGYTTFSSFGLETLALAKQGDWTRACVYVASSVALSLIAVWFGVWLATRLSAGTHQ
jgi:CrcB protein